MKKEKLFEDRFNPLRNHIRNDIGTIMLTPQASSSLAARRRCYFFGCIND